jgi:hypothetical protein
MTDRALTVRQPWADLIMAGVKDVENRSWPVPSTVPHHYACDYCEYRVLEGQEVSPCGTCGRYGARPDGPFPFPLMIHAAAKPDATEPWEAWLRWSDLYTARGDHRPAELILPERTGVLLGTVEVTGCHHADECERTRQSDPYVDATREVVYCSRWAQPDTWHWTLADPQPLDTPVPAKGRLGLWTLEPPR